VLWGWKYLISTNSIKSGNDKVIFTKEELFPALSVKILSPLFAKRIAQGNAIESIMKIWYINNDIWIIYQACY